MSDWKAFLRSLRRGDDRHKKQRSEIREHGKATAQVYIVIRNFLGVVRRVRNILQGTEDFPAEWEFGLLLLVQLLGNCFLAAFRAAAEKGYGVELDVQLSSDGYVVVFHDDTLDRICGVHGKVIDYPLEQLQGMKLLETAETIPLFTDVLAVLQQGAGPLIVELKTVGKRNPELCEKTREILHSYPGVFCIESFDPMIVRWFRKNAPEIFRGQLAQPEITPASSMNLASHLSMRAPPNAV